MNIIVIGSLIVCRYSLFLKEYAFLVMEHENKTDLSVQWFRNECAKNRYFSLIDNL